MARLSVSVANCTLHAGLNPPFGIFIRRASASLVLTRNSVSRICCPLFPWPAFSAASACFRFNSGNCAIACSSRCCFSFAARWRAAFCRAANASADAGSSICRRNSSTCFFDSAKSFCNRSWRRKLPAPRTHSQPHSILTHPTHRHHVLVHQRRDHLREQLVQRRPVVGAEIRQQPVIHRHSPAQPAERRALLTAPRQLPRRSDPPNRRVQPQPHQQPRIGRVPSRHSRARLDGLGKTRQIQPLHQPHHHPHRMPGWHQIVRALHHHRHLPPLRHSQPHRRLRFSRCLLLASARLAHACFMTRLLEENPEKPPRCIQKSHRLSG